jgi:K+-transporting ATPase KdpF subunit
MAGPGTSERSTMLYLTAAVALAALVYLTYAMIRPERF